MKPDSDSRRTVDAPRTRFVDTISNRDFDEWYHQRQFERNILEGTPFFNGLSPPPEPERHSPSNLLQCHRKVAYGQENAPRESSPPQGLFWVGTRFEEDVVVPYLRESVTDSLSYVQNSRWIDVTVDVDGESLMLKGSTDPVVVTEDAEPLLVTEVKTKRTLDAVEEPNPHHRAQIHAYLYALDHEFERTISDGVIIYGSRTTFDIEPFFLQFDPDFWDRVRKWMADHTRYRRTSELPPAEPEMDWECSFCSFRNRCGKGSASYEDVGYSGLLPRVSDYGRRQVREYLEAAESATLTPTLAKQYPELVERFDVANWHCPECGVSYDWDAVDWSPADPSAPICERCAAADSLTTLRVPIGGIANDNDRNESPTDIQL